MWQDEWNLNFFPWTTYNTYVQSSLLPNISMMLLMSSEVSTILMHKLKASNIILNVLL